MVSSRYKRLPNPKASVIIAQKRETQMQYAENSELVFQDTPQQIVLQYTTQEQN